MCVDNDTKIWSFGLNDYELVQEKVSHLNPDVVIGSLPKFVINLMRQGMCSSAYGEDGNAIVNFYCRKR